MFSGKVFENGWLWMAAFEQSETAACNVIWFLTIKVSSSNIEFLKITTSEPILVTMRSLEIPTQRIFNNLIKQNQKLILFWTSPQQCPVSSVYIPASRAQCPEFRVQSPVSRVQSPASTMQRPTPACPKSRNSGMLNIFRLKKTLDLKIPHIIIYKGILLPRSIFHKSKMKKIVKLAKTFWLFV